MPYRIPRDYSSLLELTYIVYWRLVYFVFTAADGPCDSKWLQSKVYFAKFSKKNVLKWKIWNCHLLQTIVAHRYFSQISVIKIWFSPGKTKFPFSTKKVIIKLFVCNYLNWIRIRYELVEKNIIIGLLCSTASNWHTLS